MAMTPYDLVGNREDLSDKQEIVFPDKTPLLAFCAEETVSNDTVTYVFDQPDQPAPTALLATTDTVSYDDAFKNRASFSTYVQELEKTFGVSNRQKSNDPAALANQLASAEIRKQGEHSREVEVLVGSDQAHGIQSGSVPFKMAGLGWYQSTSNTAIPALYRANAADATAMSGVTADTIRAVLQTVAENNGGLTDFVLFANSALYAAIIKAYLNSNVLSRVQFQHQGNRNIDLSVQMVVTEFGSFALVYAPWLGAPSTIDGTAYSLGTTQKCRGYLLRKGVISLAYKEGSKNKVSYHEDKGAGPRGSIRSIVGLKHYAPKSCAMFNATSLT